ncbi:DUF3103 family protein [Hymenobacter cheonanensis]|uniref:DUF3103 family protein n=1 Tax=Hymenobacter sp. CA2-7 TaxID=3063993 RepID=UPI002713F3B8|nr:DUF3103 family protein [Hymenobacter sp. CA2-7]MDO7884557.1 DUF3103 family protein [Hymenobacter sp. CA2-7]
MGCNRDKIAQELPQPTETALQTQANQELAALAKALARTLGTDAATRQQLKAAALQKFDGDYDVLYQPFVAEHSDFGQRVASAVASADPAGLTMPALLGRIPMLNISVPVNIDKWDAANYAPLVIFIPAGYSERTATRVKAFDQEGNEHWLDAKKAPAFPVVVVGPSERVASVDAVIKAGSTLAALKPLSIAEGNQPANIRVPEEGDGGGTTSPAPAPSPYKTTASTCRTDKQTEYLRSRHMEDVSVYESWFLGDPEIKLQIKGALGGNGVTYLYSSIFTPSRSDIEDTYFPNAQLYYWDTSVTADAVLYYWLEQDGGTIGTVTFGLEYTTASGVKGTTGLSFPIGSDDDEIGYKAMNFDFCPSIGYYSLSAEGG